MVGRILEQVRLRRTVPGAEDVRWMEVCVGEKNLVAADAVGAEPGDLVLLSSGSAGWRLIHQCPAEAVIIGVLQENEKKVDKSGENKL